MLSKYPLFPLIRPFNAVTLTDVMFLTDFSVNTVIMTSVAEDVICPFTGVLAVIAYVSPAL